MYNNFINNEIINNINKKNYHISSKKFNEKIITYQAKNLMIEKIFECLIIEFFNK